MEEIQIISKNFAKGKMITDVNDIVKLAEQRKSIYHDGCMQIRPASFYLQWRFILLLRLLNKANLFYTIPIRKNTKLFVTTKK